jgi:hypothetical protein
MPYRDPLDRLAAKRRYNASPKGKETAHRYWLSKKGKTPEPINPEPLAQALSHWSKRETQSL